MAEPWFDANSYAWLPGTVLGSLTGLWGALAGTLAPRGKGKGLVFGIAFVLLVSAAVMLVAGVYAWLTGQPYGIWYGLGWPGLLMLVLMIPLSVAVVRAYRQAEERQMSARDID
jgi:hypothetical protein